MTFSRLRDAGLLLGLTFLTFGLMRAPIDWKVLLPRGVDATVAAAFAGAFGFALTWIRRWTPAAGALIAVLVLAIVFSGLPSVAATFLLALGAVAVGTLLPRPAGLDPLVRWIAGAGLIAGVGGWLLPFPVHRGAVWALALATVALVRRREVLEDLRVFLQTYRERMRAAPRSALAWSLTIAIATLPAWLPIGNVDDLAYHLNIGNEFLVYGHGLLDIGAESWALAPWSSDLLHAIVTVMAGREGTGPLNAVWLVSGALLVQSLGCSLGLSSSRAWLASMLYVSLPLTAFLAGSMQTEAATVAMVAALALAILGDAATRAERLPAIAALAGFGLAIKVSNGLLLAPFAVWLIAAWARSFPWRAFPLAVALGVFAAGSSYAYATVLTGDPVVPLFNAYFRTPWFPPENFSDGMWQTGFGVRGLWGLVFDTSKYFEGYAGAAGLVLIALAGGIPLALARPATRAVAVVGLAALLLMFHQIQYLRYLHPALAILIPALVAGLVPETGRWSWRESLLAVVVVLQIALMPTASWKFVLGALRMNVTNGDTAVSDHFVPERSLQRRLQLNLQPTDRVLYSDPARSHGAELPGRAVGTAWFTPLVSGMQASTNGGSDRLKRVVERAGANYVLAYDLPSNPEVAAFLVASSAQRVDANGAAGVYWLPPPLLKAASIVQVSSAELGFDVVLGRRYPMLGQAVVAIRCDRPGKPVAVAWSLLAAGVGHWDWVNCGQDGVAITSVQFHARVGGGPLHLVAKPADSTSDMKLTGLLAASDVRRDFSAETALYRWVWNELCSRPACDAGKPDVAPLAEGELVDYVLRAAGTAAAPTLPGAKAPVAAPEQAEGHAPATVAPNGSGASKTVAPQ